MNWREIIALNRKSCGEYQVFHRESGVHVADFLVKEDGYFEYWTPLEKPQQGYLPSYILRAYADCLDELNKEWDEEVKNVLTSK